MYTRASSIRSVCHSASQRNKSVVAGATAASGLAVDPSIGGPGGTKRSCSFNYIEQSANGRVMGGANRNASCTKSTWIQPSGGVKFDPPNSEFYPKVAYQQVSNGAEDASLVLSAEIHNQFIEDGLKENLAYRDGCHCDDTICICLNDIPYTRRYSDDYVEL